MSYKSRKNVLSVLMYALVFAFLFFGGLYKVGDYSEPIIINRFSTATLQFIMLVAAIEGVKFMLRSDDTPESNKISRRYRN